MIQRGDGGRGEAQHESVEGEVMIELAPIIRALVLVEAADAAAVEIAQLAGVAKCLPQRFCVGRHPDRLANVAPERAHAHDERHDGVHERGGKQRRHRVVRHQPVERARSGVDTEQHLAVMHGGEAEDEGCDTERCDQADHNAVSREERRQRPAARHRRRRIRRGRSRASAAR